MEEDDILYQSIIADPETVSPDVDISRLRTQTETSPELLAAVSEFPGLQFDPTQYSAYEDLYDLYSTGLPMIPTPATDTAQIPGAADILVDTGSQDQGTGDTVDQPLVESGEFGGQPTFTTTPGTTVDSITGDIIRPDGSYGGNIVDEFLPVSGTFGSNEVLTTTTGTQIDSETGDITAPDGSFAGNIVDEFGTAGDVYSGAQGPTGIGTGNVLDEFGTAGDVYSGAPTSGGIVDEVALTGGLGAPPSIESLEPPAIQEPLITPTDILLTGIGGLLDIPLNLGITTAQASMPTQPDLVDPTISIDEFAEEDNVNVGTNTQTPAEQIYGDEGETTSDAGFADAVNEADVEAGLATESIFDEPALTPAPAPAPAPAPVYYDSGNGDSGGGSSSSSTAGDAPGYSGPSPFKEGGFVKKHAKR